VLERLRTVFLGLYPPVALFPTLRPGRECADDECGHMGWPNHYSSQRLYLLQLSF
jgi:hypothetical protein